jgi:hypothetical protein
MPTARSRGAAAAYHGLFYAGGECKDQATRTAFNENEAYDPKTDRWTKMPPLPEGWHAFGAAHRRRCRRIMARFAAPPYVSSKTHCGLSRPILAVMHNTGPV